MPEKEKAIHEKRRSDILDEIGVPEPKPKTEVMDKPVRILVEQCSIISGKRGECVQVKEDFMNNKITLGEFGKRLVDKVGDDVRFRKMVLYGVKSIEEDLKKPANAPDKKQAKKEIKPAPPVAAPESEEDEEDDGEEGEEGESCEMKSFDGKNSSKCQIDVGVGQVLFLAKSIPGFDVDEIVEKYENDEITAEQIFELVSSKATDDDMKYNIEVVKKLTRGEQIEDEEEGSKETPSE